MADLDRLDHRDRIMQSLANLELVESGRLTPAQRHVIREIQLHGLLQHGYKEKHKLAIRLTAGLEVDAQKTFDETTHQMHVESKKALAEAVDAEEQQEILQYRRERGPQLRQQVHRNLAYGEDRLQEQAYRPLTLPPPRQRRGLDAFFGRTADDE